ncbi:MAG: hypothetical protein H6643_01810 [Caldilineaceae bacterium]|nr:hypothetical protein [Caldilineaceae bacterium]
MSTNKALQWLIPPIIVLAIMLPAQVYGPRRRTLSADQFCEAVNHRAGGLYLLGHGQQRRQMQANGHGDVSKACPCSSSLLLADMRRGGASDNRCWLARWASFYTDMSMCFGTALQPTLPGLRGTLRAGASTPLSWRCLLFDLTTLLQHFSERLLRR